MTLRRLADLAALASVLVFAGCGTTPSLSQVGPAGPQGPAGPAGINFRGAYVNGTAYATTDSAAQIGRGINPTANSLQFINTQIVDGNGDLHAGTIAPPSNSPCTPGALRVVAPYVYACVAPSQWMRAPLASY